MDQAYLKHIAQLEARINRMETIIQALLIRLDIDPAEVTPQEPPEVRALRDTIRAAVLAGDKVKAIKLYRDYYGVGLKEAMDAIDAM